MPTVDKELISSADMLKSSLDKIYIPGRTYTAHDSVLGEVRAMFVLTVGPVGIQGAGMYPKTGSFDVAGDFLCDDNENGSGIIGEEWCLGSWLGGITTVAGFGFVQVSGLNLVPITTDGSVAAKDVLLPTTADGVWEGVNSDTLVSAATDNLATRCAYVVSVQLAPGSVLWDVHQPGV